MHIFIKNSNFLSKKFADSKKSPIFAAQYKNVGAIAQLVEQRTENPCVTGSIPVGTTSINAK